ncbi:MAG: class I SAM-dependent methyltransferase [Parahaliea sp.]
MKYLAVLFMTVLFMGTQLVDARTVSKQIQAVPDWDTALQGEQRSAQNKARDGFRHPRQTLEFFGFKPDMTVVELSPGGGWYTEILAPLLQAEGHYYAAHSSLSESGAYYRRSLGNFLLKLGSDEATYNKVIVTPLRPPVQVTVAPEGTADLVLAFRNIHSWMRADALDAVLEASFKALKPGGHLGVVQHRSKMSISVEQMKKNGYVTEQYVIDAAQKAGFELVERSSINANPKDPADDLVWRLPPSLRGDENRREEYQAIGESDRMTLLFARPKT